MKKVSLSVLTILILLSALIYYQKPLRLWAYDWSHAIIGGLYGTTGTPLKVDSDGAVYVDMSGMSLIYSGTKRGSVSTIVSTVSKLTSTNLAFALLKLSGADKTFSIAAGEEGQTITFVKDQYDARTLVLDLRIDASPTTHSGWSSVTWPTAAGGYVTLAWPDDTTGWIITGSENVTITY